MKQILALIFLIVMCLSILIGCTSSNVESEDNSITYEQISAAEARAIMDSQESYILLDVRTQKEYDEGHIEGAILLPDYEIGTKAETVLVTKTH